MGNCPSCGRYVGPYEACPYCGASLAPRLAVRLLKVGALVLAILGVMALILTAREEKIPYVVIESIGPSMNYAYLHVGGRVSRQPSLDLEQGTLDFWLDDGTGELYVAAYRREAEALLERGMIPHLGDQIELEGTVRLRDEFRALTLNVPDSMQINRPRPESVAIGAINSDWSDRAVEVMGIVRRTRCPYTGLTLVTVRDSSGAIDVVIPDEVLALTGDLSSAVLASGSSVRIAGVVSLYEGTPQITLVDASEAVELQSEIDFAPSRAIAELDRSHMGLFTRVQGQIVRVATFSAGERLVLNDGTGTVTVVVWRDLAEPLVDQPPLEVGSQVVVVGEIAEYGGELEIIPERTADIKVVGVAAKAPIRKETASLETTERPAAVSLTPTSAPLATSTPELLLISTLGQIGLENVGETHTIAAQVIDANSFSAGFKFLLDDGGGQITLLVWSDYFTKLSNRQDLVPGASLLVTGTIGLYQGQLQLEPTVGGVTVVQTPDDFSGPHVLTGELASHVEQLVTIEGQIVGLDSFAGDNLRLTVDDGSGTVQVVVWHTVFQFVPPDWLVMGQMIVVTGRVSVYDGVIQLVPALPSCLSPAGSEVS